MMKPMGVCYDDRYGYLTIATLLIITPVYYSLTDSVAARSSGLLKIKLPKFNYERKIPVVVAKGTIRF